MPYLILNGIYTNKPEYLLKATEKIEKGLMHAHCNRIARCTIIEKHPDKLILEFACYITFNEQLRIGEHAKRKWKIENAYDDFLRHLEELLKYFEGGHDKYKLSLKFVSDTPDGLTPIPNFVVRHLSRIGRGYDDMFDTDLYN